MSISIEKVYLRRSNVEDDQIKYLMDGWLFSPEMIVRRVAQTDQECPEMEPDRQQ